MDGEEFRRRKEKKELRRDSNTLNADVGRHSG
jgi:hypothetical protein